MLQGIAESWPDALDDTTAREEWDWKPEYDLDAMTDVMLEAISERLGGSQGTALRPDEQKACIHRECRLSCMKAQKGVSGYLFFLRTRKSSMLSSAMGDKVVCDLFLPRVPGARGSFGLSTRHWCANSPIA